MVLLINMRVVSGWSLKIKDGLLRKGQHLSLWYLVVVWIHEMEPCFLDTVATSYRVETLH